jgi:hypothetical protein
MHAGRAANNTQLAGSTLVNPAMMSATIVIGKSPSVSTSGRRPTTGSSRRHNLRSRRNRRSRNRRSLCRNLGSLCNLHSLCSRSLRNPGHIVRLSGVFRRFPCRKRRTCPS